jgi:hypothetical protein
MPVNLKTASALGIDVPLFFQQRADEEILLHQKRRITLA